MLDEKISPNDKGLASGYDAPLTSLLFDDAVAGASHWSYLVEKATPAMKLGSLSGYDAPVTFLPVVSLVAGASNPTYGKFHGNPTYREVSR